MSRAGAPPSFSEGNLCFSASNVLLEVTGLSRGHTNTIFAHQIPAYPYSSYQLTLHAHTIRIITTQEIPGKVIINLVLFVVNSGFQPAASSHFGTRRLALSHRSQITKSPGIRTSTKRARNSSRIRTYKTQDLKPFRIRTYRKGEGGGGHYSLPTAALVLVHCTPPPPRNLCGAKPHA